MYIKVDYSEQRKSKCGRPNMPGEFAIYTKKHWWNKWEQGQTYASLEGAERDAKRLRETEVKLPIYF